MQRVNEAFRLRDLAALKTILQESIAEDPDWAERPVTDRLAWAEAELQTAGGRPGRSPLGAGATAGQRALSPLHAL